MEFHNISLYGLERVESEFPKKKKSRHKEKAKNKLDRSTQVSARENRTRTRCWFNQRNTYDPTVFEETG